MNICLVCLRTDRLLKLASNVLEDFHDEICNFSVISTVPSCYYCIECEYLMTKFYKLKEKCMKALHIYQNWKRTRIPKKKPLNSLHTQMSPSPLGPWTPSPANIRNIKFQDINDHHPYLPSDGELVQDSTLVFSQEIKIEIDQSSCIDNDLNLDFVKNEDSPENIPLEDVPQLKNITQSRNTPSPGNSPSPGNIPSPGSISSPGNISSSDVKDLKKDSDIEECSFLEQLNKILEDDPDDETDIKVKIKNEREIRKKLSKILKKKPIRQKKQSKKTRERIMKKIENDKEYKSVFDIEYLTTQEQKLEEFESRKTYECYVKAKFKCEICCQVFKNSISVEQHTNKCHTEKEGHICCPICKMWIPGKLVEHRTRYHSVVYKCKECLLVTYFRTSMQNHFQWHKGKQYHCEECNTTYKSKSTYTYHVSRHHRRGRHVCLGCGRGFVSPMGLIVHKSNSTRCTAAKETLPPDAEGVRCEECDVTLPSQEVYQKHIVDVHQPARHRGALRLVRNSMGLPEHRKSKKSSLQSRKVKLIRRVTPHKHLCRVCNTYGGSFGWLQRHFKVEHPNEDINLIYLDKKKHLCDVCGAGFCTVYGLQNHMTIHTGDRPYQCDLCPKRFRSDLIMRDHRLRHFPSTMCCTYCGKQFKTRSNLTNHMRIHTGEKNHKCGMCGKTFLHSTSLREHVKGVHFNIRRVRKGGVREEAAGSGAPAKRAKTNTETESDDYHSDDSQ